MRSESSSWGGDIAEACFISPIRDNGNQNSQQRDEFLKERLCLFGLISSGLCLSFYLLTNLTAVLSGTQDLFACLDRPRNLSLLCACLVLLSPRWLGARGKLSRERLRALDASTTTAVCILFALGAWLDIRIESGLPPYLAALNILLGFTNVLIGRAVIIPSEAARTLRIGAFSLAPILASIIWITMARPGRSPLAVAGLEAGIFLIWGISAVVISAITSRIIFGLRRQILVARKLGNYVLAEKIGEGSMGEVYRAYHCLLRRPTAIKILRKDRAGERNIAHFEREVQITSGLSHPNTVAIYDYGRTPDGTFFYAMEYLSGITLDELATGYGPQPPGRVIHILKQVCGSLAEAHSKGLIHRDIKGANVILCSRGGAQDVVKVLDFGLVKEFENQTDLARTAAKTIDGTPLYISPEAIRCLGGIDSRSDLYSVGVLGYLLITGRYVFHAEFPTELFDQHLHQAPTPPSVQLGTMMPADLEALILQCLEKDPDRRPQSARNLQFALDRCKSARDWDEAAAMMWWKKHGGGPKRRAFLADETLILPDLTDLGVRLDEAMADSSKMDGSSPME